MLEIDAKSGYMKTRDGGFDRDMKAMKDSLTPFASEIHIPYLNATIDKRKVHDAQFAMIRAMDRAAAYSVWYASYRMAIDGNAFNIDGMTDAQVESEAILFADSTTSSQSSSFRADLTEMQRSNGLGYFMSMFMSGNVRQAGRLLQHLDAKRLGDKTAVDLTLFLMQEHMFPAAAWVLVRAGLLGLLGLYEPEDENIAADLAWESLGNAGAAFPYLREIPSFFQYGNAGRVPALDTLSRQGGNFMRGFRNLANEEYDKAAFNFGDVAGYAAQVPILNLYRDIRPLLQAAGLSEGGR
jgi:hypothetical protein